MNVIDLKQYPVKSEKKPYVVNHRVSMYYSKGLNKITSLLDAKNYLVDLIEYIKMRYADDPKMYCSHTIFLNKYKTDALLQSLCKQFLIDYNTLLKRLEFMYSECYDELRAVRVLWESSIPKEGVTDEFMSDLLNTDFSEYFMKRSREYITKIFPLVSEKLPYEYTGIKYDYKDHVNDTDINGIINSINLLIEHIKCRYVDTCHDSRLCSDVMVKNAFKVNTMFDNYCKLLGFSSHNDLIKLLENEFPEEYKLNLRVAKVLDYLYSISGFRNKVSHEYMEDVFGLDFSKYYE